MVLELLLIIITLVVLLVSSYTDIKTREVPDWISYGLIFSALGIRTIYSLSLDWNILISGLIGFVICFLIACLFYYTNQWGGGDSKLLMGMGAVIGIAYPFSTGSLQLLLFIIALLFLGAVYGLFWMGYVAIKNRNAFKEHFKKELKEYQNIQIAVGILAVIFIGLTVIFHFVWPMIFFPIGMLYFFLFVSTVEQCCFFRKIKIENLTEGDWLAENVQTSAGTILRKRRALERKDLDELMLLKKNKNLKEVLIKEGIPFVPSFLWAYLFILLSNDVWKWLLKVFV